MCPLYRIRTCPKGHEPQITCDRALTGCRSCTSDYGFVSGTSAGRELRRTGENSRWLAAVVLCHIIADVTSCVTRRKQAFNIECSKLRGKTHRRRDIVGSGVDYNELEECECK